MAAFATTRPYADSSDGAALCATCRGLVLKWTNPAQALFFMFGIMYIHDKATVDGLVLMTALI